MTISLTEDQNMALYEDALCACLSTDFDGKILLLDNTFAQWVRHTKPNLLGKNLQELLAPASRLMVETYCLPRLRTQGYIHSIRLEFTRPGGPSLSVLATFVVKETAQGRGAHVHIVLIDITDRTQQGFELVEAERGAERLVDVIRVCDRAILTAGFDLTAKMWNPAATSLFGENLALGTLLEDLLPERCVRLFASALECGTSKTAEVTLPSGRILQVNGSPISEGLAIFFSDITKERAWQQDSERADERFRLATMATTDGIWDFDCIDGAVYYSARWRSILGLGEDDLTGTIGVWRERLHPDDVQRARGVWKELKDDSKTDLEIELRLRHEDGTWRWILCRGLGQRDQAGRLRRITGAISDITARKIVDPLTNLHNRLSLLEQVQWRIDRDSHHERCYALLFLDLDLFKRINDSLGHLKGDALLVEIGRRLEETVKLVPGSLVSRLGGDEFVVLLGDVAHEEDALTYASMLQYLLEVPIDCRGKEVCISASIGVAVGYPGTYTEAEQVLEDADVAMYAAKANGRAQSATFTQKMRANATARLEDEAALRIALSEQQFELFYQPSVELKTGAILGFEALIRWHHPSRGLVGPSTFIPIAEETGLISQIGRWALGQAIRQLAMWRQSHSELNNATMAVNLSTKQLNEMGLVEEIGHLLETTGVPAASLALEVTESMLMEDAEGAVAILQTIADRGVCLYMDDFGTGYSSLSYLHRFPFHCLKIDRSFIERMDDDSKSIKLVSAIVSLGASLGMCVIAEGVETELQRITLLQMGCQQAQGFLFSPASSADTIERLLSNARGTAAFPPS